MDIVMKKISELKPYENNPRDNDKAVEYVEKSIKEFGFKVPVVIDGSGTILAGHTRYKACQNLNIKEVPCIVADDLTEEQAKAFRLADNKVSEYAVWDFEKLDIELDEIVGIDLEQFGFVSSEIDWESIEDLDETTYEEPQHRMLECPKCHHIDRDIHFKKVDVAAEEIPDEDILECD